MIDGEEIKSFREIKDKYGISPTLFLNQVSKKKKHFLDRNEILHSVSFFSPELEKIIDGEKRQEMNKKIMSQLKDCAIKESSYDVLSKKQINIPKEFRENMNMNDRNLLDLDQNFLVSISKRSTTKMEK